MNIKNFAGKIFSKFCSATYAIERPVNYPLPMKIFHWGMVFGLFGTVGFVKMCQYTPKEDPKKCCGLVMGLCAVGRLMIRNKSVLPKDMPVTKGWHAPAWKVAKIAHYLLYCGMIFMPVTGIAMGIAGGKGVPFFDYFTIPGLPNEQKKAAGFFYTIHKKTGQFFEYVVVPAHMTGGLSHGWKGIRRIL